MKRVICVLISAALLGLLPGAAAALTAKDMARFLPAELAGFKAPNPALTNDLKTSGMSISSAARVYLKAGAKVKLDLVSGPMVANLAKMASLKLMRDDAVSRVKTYAVAGYNAIEVFQKNLKLLTIQVFVSNRIMIVARQDSPDPGPALKLIKALDLRGLAKLK